MPNGVAPSRIPTPPFASLRGPVRFAPGIGRMHMTLLHMDRTGSSGLRLAFRAPRKLIAALKVLHRAIVAAKLRRLRHELMLRRAPAEFDAAQFPQRPLMLGDKWDS